MKRASRVLSALLVVPVLSLSVAAQTLPVPESIRAEGVPPIPLTIPQALARYQNIRAASFQDWDGAGGIYITTRFADTAQVHHVSGPGQDRRQLTFLNERILNVVARPKHDQFLYSTDEGGAENYQFFLQDRKGGEARRITDGKSRNTSPAWSPSGELLAWSSNARNGRDMDLYVGAPVDPHFVRLFKEVFGDWGVVDWSPDETRVVAQEYLSSTESYLHIIEIGTGKTTTITPRKADPKAESVYAGLAKWAPNGKAIYYITDKDAEFRRLVRYDLASGEVKILTESIPWDVESYDVSDNGNYVAVAVNEDGLSHVYGINLMTGYSDRILLRRSSQDSPSPYDDFIRPPRRPLPIGQIGGLAFQPNSNKLGFTYSGSQASADAYSLDLTEFPEADKLLPASALVRWTKSETGGLDTSEFAEPALVHFPSFDGKQIPAFVYRPPAAKFPGPRPVLIQIHGGPESQFQPGFLGRLNYLINELGLVLIMPNVRGSSGYGKTYVKLDNGMLREGAVKDIGALLDWIATDPGLDKTRVGVTGGSYGGFMSLAVQTTYNDRIKAGIDIVGISNFVTFLQNTQSYRRDLRRAEYGDEREPAMREFLERLSPLASVGKIHTPILIVQGQNDPRVPLSEAEQVVAAVRKNNVPVWYVVGKNEGHGFAKKVNQDYLQAVEVVFLRRYLLGEPE